MTKLPLYRIVVWNEGISAWESMRKKFVCIGDIIKFANVNGISAFRIKEIGDHSYLWGHEDIVCSRQSCGTQRIK